MSGSVGGRIRWVALFVILGGNALDLIDSTVVNVGAPSIRADIGGGDETIQWIAGGYTLALAIGLVIGGRLGDLFGRRRLFLIALSGFVAASLACSLAGSPEFLIAARIAQGLSAAFMLPQGLGMIRSLFPPAELPKAFGLFGTVLGLAAVAGPVVAGLLISADIFGTGWRSIFWVNIPLGLVILVAGLASLPRDRERIEDRRVDLIGFGLISIGASAVIFGLNQGREWGWPWWLFLLLAGGVASLLLLALHVRRRERRGLVGVVTASAFRHRSFVSALLFGAMYFAAVVGVSLCYALYLQIGRGLSPLLAGLSILPSPLGIAIGSAIAGATSAGRGRRLIRVGLALLVGGLSANLIVLATTGTPPIPALLPGLLVAGIGMGLVFSPFFGIALADLRGSEVGSASGTLSAVQQFGSSLGIAIVATVFFSAADPAAGDFAPALGWALVVTLGLTVASAALTLLLPRAATRQEEWAS